MKFLNTKILYLTALLGSTHIFAMNQPQSPQPTMPSPSFWTQNFPDFNYTNSPAFEINTLQPNTSDADQAALNYAARRAQHYNTANLTTWLTSPVAPDRTITHIASPEIPAATGQAYALARSSHYYRTPQTAPRRLESTVTTSPVAIVAPNSAQSYAAHMQAYGNQIERNAAAYRTLNLVDRIRFNAPTNPFQVQWFARPNRYLTSPAASEPASVASEPRVARHPIFVLNDSPTHTPQTNTNSSNK